MSTEACACGHSPEAHGQDPAYPLATDCTECSCIAYECDRDHDESEAPCPSRDKLRMSSSDWKSRVR
jgi:hypothetical protein